MYDKVSATTPVWSREACRHPWDPSGRLLKTIRKHERWGRRRAPLSWIRFYWTVAHRFWSVVAGVDIPLGTKLGGGLLMPHPNGIVIHGLASVGPNCLIFQQVTVGTGGKKPGVPEVGGHVDIGAGAKLLGGIRVGDHARIGANAVVLDDVPSGATAVGVPARVVRRHVGNGTTTGLDPTPARAEPADALIPEAGA